MSAANLHAQIMNLPCTPATADELQGYRRGHRDARHAAAELSLAHDAINAELLQALQTVRGVILLQRDLIEQGKHVKAWAPTMKVIDAAIAKATGAAQQQEVGNEPDKITIRYERTGQCFWHVGCKSRHHAPPMRVGADDAEKRCTVIRCTACNEAGYYPHGSVGDVRCERVAAAPSTTQGAA